MFAKYLSIAVIGLALLSGGPAHALPAEHATAAVLMVDVARTDAVFADRVSLEQAVRRVRKQYGGRIVNAETRGSGQSRTHVIKVLTDNGRVVTVRIPAN